MGLKAKKAAVGSQCVTFVTKHLHSYEFSRGLDIELCTP